MYVATESTVEVWDMTHADRVYLDRLPEVVDLWHAHPSGSYGRDTADQGIFYLQYEAGWAGARAFAHSHILAEIHGVVVRREFIVAIDLERQTAQLVVNV